MKVVFQNKNKVVAACKYIEDARINNSEIKKKYEEFKEMYKDKFNNFTIHKDVKNEHSSLEKIIFTASDKEK